MSFPVKTCTVCGRRGINGTARCELHPFPPRPTEAQRLVAEPYRREYGSRDYRRNRTLVLRRAANRCEGCGNPLGERPHVDHIIPIKDEGTSELSNLQALCRSCHHAKTKADRRARRER